MHCPVIKKWKVEITLTGLALPNVCACTKKGPGLSKDGLVNPRLLDFDKSTNRLLVVNVSESAFLFDVTVG
jgi:hypothetical protein